MKKIDISTDVFAKLWSLWQPGEETEDDILRRLLSSDNSTPSVETVVGTDTAIDPSLAEENTHRKSSPRRPFEVTRFETANFHLDGTKYDVDAFAIYKDGKWTVLSGSKVMSNWIGSESDGSYENLHLSLKRKGIIEPTSDDYAVFTEDYTFTSPSAASAVVVGRSDNGRNSWKHIETGQTFNDWVLDGDRA